MNIIKKILLKSKSYSNFTAGAERPGIEFQVDDEMIIIKYRKSKSWK